MAMRMVRKIVNNTDDKSMSEEVIITNNPEDEPDETTTAAEKFIENMGSPEGMMEEVKKRIKAAGGPDIGDDTKVVVIGGDLSEAEVPSPIKAILDHVLKGMAGDILGDENPLMQKRHM